MCVCVVDKLDADYIKRYLGDLTPLQERDGERGRWEERKSDRVRKRRELELLIWKEAK